MKTTTTPTYLADTCERITIMNNASPEMKEQCNFLLDWMQDRIEDLLLEKMYDEAYALYMEWPLHIKSIRFIIHLLKKQVLNPILHPV